MRKPDLGCKLCIYFREVICKLRFPFGTQSVTEKKPVNGDFHSSYVEIKVQFQQQGFMFYLAIFKGAPEYIRAIFIYE